MDELLDMPSDVERAARVKVGTDDSTHMTQYPTIYTYIVFFYLFLCRIYWLTVLNPLR